MEYTHDVIIIGAGPGGAYAANKLARLGYHVAIFEKKNKNNVGNKPCGEALLGHCFDEFRKLGVSLSEKYRTKKVLFYTNKTETPVELKYDIVMIDRHELVSGLLDSVSGQAEIFYESTVKRPILRSGAIKGVSVRLSDGTEKTFTAKVLIDASGYPGKLRICAPDSAYPLRENYSAIDLAIAFRIVNGDVPFKETIIKFNQSLYRGGYFWLFPRGGETNIGVGAIKNYIEPKLLPRILRDELTSLHLEVNPTDPMFGVIPARRPFAALSGINFILVGDAGSLTNPIHGGGICSSVRSANYAVSVVDGFLSSANSSLWDYSKKVNNREGRKHAIFELGRIFLEGLSDSQITYLIRLIAELSQEPDIIVNITKKDIFKLISAPRIAWRLLRLRNLIRRVSRLYDEYPDKPSKIFGWAKKINDFFDYARKLLIPKTSRRASLAPLSVL